MRTLTQLFRGRAGQAVPDSARVAAERARFASMSDAALLAEMRTVSTAASVIGAAAVVASRTLGQEMVPEQIDAALALTRPVIVEMQTGEGKTLAAVPAVAWHARTGAGVHVLTANDYLARRDADWMRPIYTGLGLSVTFVQQDMSPAERREAYRADVTYATANEIGFDYLRDGLALDPTEQVHRPFATVLVDEADSILIDEARIPLVIAGGSGGVPDLSIEADRAVRQLLPGRHFTVEQFGRNVVLTPLGIDAVQHATGFANLFDPSALAVHTAIQDALHAHALLRRDVDYVVTDGRVVSVDEIKGRTVPDRRWPAGLQTAIEAKEAVRRHDQGRVLGSVTIEHLVALYGRVAGMTGTAVTQAAEFKDIYGLDVVVIAPHRPVIREDAPDVVFDSVAEKELAIRAEVRRVHATGRPVLVGTASVAASERLSRALADLPHHVLNARHETEEAAIIARAGQRDAVTISTNMAGRGVDIRLGDGVAALGGLHVVGTTRHESRRIDNQLRGRSGRQGDPGSSRFFVSREDPLIATLIADDPAVTIDQCQRFVEGQHLDIRLFLRKYESIVEGQRLAIAARRQRLLTGEDPSPSSLARAIRLATIDEFWSDFLSAVAELRSGTAMVSLGYMDPFAHFLGQAHAMFGEMDRGIETETADRLGRGDTSAVEARQRGATWTYLTTDEPFGRMTERVMREMVRRFRAWRQAKNS